MKHVIHEFKNDMSQKEMGEVFTLNERSFCYTSGNVDKNYNYVTGGLIRIYNRKELLKQFDVKDPIQNNQQIILHGFAKYELGFVSYLNASFGFFLTDIKLYDIYLITDYFGSVPVYYINNNEYFIASDNLKYILHFDKNKSLNKRYLHLNSKGIFPGYTETVYAEIKKLAPRHILHFNPVKFACKHYTTVDFQNVCNLKNEQEFYMLLQEKFTYALKNRIVKGLNGFELSGGIDSSSIVSTAIHKHLIDASNVKTYSHIHSSNKTNGYRKDEQENIEYVLNKYSITETYINSEETPILELLLKHVKLHKKPLFQFYTVFSEVLFKKLRDDSITNLFSGFGGDQMVSSSGFELIKSLIYKRKYLKLLQLALERDISRYRFYGSILRELQNQLFTKNSLFRNETHLSHLNEKKINTPEEVYKILLYEKLFSPYINQRIEDIYLLSNEYNFQYSLPFLDIDLVRTYLSIPISIYYNPNWPRNAIRQSMTGILPEKIRIRRDKNIATIPWAINKIYNESDELINFLKNHKSDEFTSYLVNTNELIRFLQNIKSGIPPARLNYRQFLIKLSLLLFLDLHESS